MYVVICACGESILVDSLEEAREIASWHTPYGCNWDICKVNDEPIESHHTEEEA